MEIELSRFELKYSELRIQDPVRQGRLSGRLATEGQQNPVSVIQSSEHGYILIDGYRRVSALTSLGKDTVEAQVLDMSEVDALLMTCQLEPAGKRTILEEAWVLREPHENFGLSQQDLATRFHRSVSWISRRLGLIKELPSFIHEFVREGSICAHVAMKYLVPLTRAKRGDCERQAENIKGHSLSSRQVGRLYSAWRLADVEQRSEIIGSPLLYLKIDESLNETPPLPDEEWEENLIRDLEIIGSISRRVRRYLRDSAAVLRKIPFPNPLRNAWDETRMDIDALTRILKEHLDA